MTDKIKVLVIAPYTSMEPLLINTAKEFPEIDLTIRIGDLNAGVDAAMTHAQSNYDVLISRGGTAELLQKAVSTPVVEIGVSAYDIMRTLKLANATSVRTAVVGFPNIAREMEMLQDLLPYHIDVYPIHSAEEATATLHKLFNSSYISLLCDMITHTVANELGMNTFLINSGIESIRVAFRDAIFICQANRQLRLENRFYRQLLQTMKEQTVVFSEDGKLIYSTVDKQNAEILNLLWNKVNELPVADKHKFSIKYKDLFYQISAFRVRSSENSYITFHFSAASSPRLTNQAGITFFNHTQVQDDCRQGPYNMLELSASTYHLIQEAASSPHPVLITGEPGTGKGYVARQLYLRGSLNHRHFIEIDCQMLNVKTWHYLLNNYSSPLLDAENTLFFENVESLTRSQQQELFSFFATGGVISRNRIIFSVVEEAGNRPHNSITSILLGRIKCRPISLPPLRMQPQLVSHLINLYLNRLNINTGSQFSGLEPQALQLLCSYSWPQNYPQLQRILERIVSMTNQQVISVGVVEEVLQHEVLMTSIQTNVSPSISLDISKPLHQINCEIAQLVLAANNGNKTLTAQSLGISRSTLWRMIR